MDNLEQAIHDVKVLKKPIRKAARDNKVNYNTLYRHIKYPDIQGRGKQTLLNKIKLLFEKPRYSFSFCYDAVLFSAFG